MTEKKNAPAATEAISKTSENNIATAQKIGNTIAPNFDGIPASLKTDNRWAPWAAVWNDKRQKVDKIPRRADRPAFNLSTDKVEWYSFDMAVKGYQALCAPGGVGYLLTGIENFIGIDLDDCVKKGKVDNWAQKIVDQASTYTEISPSGNGLRLFLHGACDDEFSNHDQGIEVYAGKSPRFLTVTGQRLGDYPAEVAVVAPGFITGLVSQYKLERASIVVQVDMPDLVEVTALPEVLSPSTRAFLERGEVDGDRSRRLAAVTAELYKGTVKADGSLDDAMVLSILTSNEFAMEIALSHRRNDADRAIVYLWEQHCCKMRGKVSVADPDAFETLDLAPPVLTRTKSGAVQATRNNIAAVLRRSDISGYQLRYDTFRNEMMFAPHWTNEWQSFTDEMQSTLAMILESNTSNEKSFVPIPATLMREMVSFVAAENKFDSAKFWIESLTWDGLPRIDRFLIDYFGTEDTEYHRAIGRYLWTGLAGRATVPGIKCDMVPVAVGDQGLQKTSTIMAIAPSPEFVGEVNLAAKDADICRALRGKLILEFGELRGMNARAMEHVKSFISAQHDEWIGKFREYATKAPRRCLFFGSTNQTEFLQDVTGNRRWLPFNAGDCEPEGLALVRDQLWAEGLARFRKNGIEWADAHALGEAHREKHFDVDETWDDKVRTWLDSDFSVPIEDYEDDAELRARWSIPIGTKWRDVPFKANEAMAAVMIWPANSSKADSNRLANVLRYLGFERTITSRMGVNGRYWIPKNRK